MTSDDFENLLRLWGWAFGTGNDRGQVSHYGDSPIARFGQLAPRSGRVHLVDRAGQARRATMGASAGIGGFDGTARPVPAWACDPIRGSQTRSAGARAVAVDDDPSFTPEVMRVERSVARLQRAAGELGQIIRAEYCTPGGQDAKAERFNLRRNAYRERLAEARGWLRRDLAGA